ncbi:hypothetical protein AJ80_07370 [Polytolypa hystricis UAMH7299]|uniref:Uncharacterized protein n=1 Tax=Polytolypa hystricis (strain UAMH7299) TaxID=1447883 RepID=A0A2B7XPB0_POLH7|nr:hypothetical protein AJ80_07370 [Polytolypa hystricis UAMH7299]
MYYHTIFAATTLLASSFSLAQVTLCPEPTSTATIRWPDDIYKDRVLTVSSVGSDAAATTWEGVDCHNNPKLTVASGPRTFSLRWWGGSVGGKDFDSIYGCSPQGDGMRCTISNEGEGAPSPMTIAVGSNEVYPVKMAVVPAQTEPLTTGIPTIHSLPYTGCGSLSHCSNYNGWCCPQDRICTSIIAGHACATATGGDFAPPALPYITAMPTGDAAPDNQKSTQNVALKALPTQAPEAIAGLFGLAIALF